MIALVGGLTLMTSCYEEDFQIPNAETPPSGYKTISFTAQVPEMEIINTRAVDPDGGGVQQITIFCFDENNLFITTATAALETDGNAISLKGKCKVTVPDHTETLQLVGNQNLTYFREDNYRGMSEVDVMAALEASAGRMIYWARETIESIETHKTADNPVKLLRNQAKITLAVDNTKTDFSVSGWIVVNTNAFGTVAPYSATHGGFVPPTLSAPFVTLPDNKERLGDFLDVRTNDEEYVFETENTEANPVDFIVKGSQNGGQELYYRISLIDEHGNHVMLMRNHHYQVNIVGALTYGQATFEEALKAPATNNVWVSISDNIPEVQDNKYRLSVDNTAVVIGEEDFNIPNTQYLYYTLEALDNESLTAADVTWMDGNDVALHNFTHSFDATTGRGTICITLNGMSNKNYREGTLSVKKGRLSRKIKVTTVKKQTFEPAWITTNIYGVGTGENVTMMFTIPEECPQGLFPMDVLISVNDLDVRSESGMTLPVIFSGSEGYGADNGIGYKYVLTVNGTGKQRVYLETSLEQQTGNQVEVTIEANHFEPLTKTATFQSQVDQWILLHNLHSYSAVQPADEVIYYHMVPQKVNAPVELPANLGKNIIWNADHTIRSFTPIAPAPEDEFLIYSKYLNHDESRSDLNFRFYPVQADKWSTGGRVHGFTPITQNQDAVFHLLTNTSRSAEVVRIASNPKGQPSVTGNGTCQSTQYRSAIFELANYHPFHFAAQINGVGTIVNGATEEETDIVELDYQPGQSVNLTFDVTSFLSSTNDSNGNLLPNQQQESVDPFGTAFDIYIDAPMLELDETSPFYSKEKISRDPNVEGRIIYHISADRATERTYGTGPALTADAKAEGGQYGERKTVPFKTKDIVTAGEISISSDESVVVYYNKTFKIHNKSITGILQYRDKQTNRVINVPYEAFVPFEMKPTYNRIGTITVGQNGQFELRLRKEYKYDWNTDAVKFQFSDGSIVYEKEFASLSALKATLATGPIILE